MSSLLPNGKQRFVDNNGRPLIGGRVYYYTPNTSTPKNTWQDESMTVLNTNPIVLDARGECTAWGTGRYRQVVRDSSGNLIWDRIVTDLSAQIDQIMEDLADPDGSSLVGFIQKGASAVARTAQDKMREHYSAADFGAVGDGTTNETAVFVAIEGGTTGKHIDLLGKTYLVDVVPKGNDYFNGAFRVVDTIFWRNQSPRLTPFHSPVPTVRAVLPNEGIFRGLNVGFFVQPGTSNWTLVWRQAAGHGVEDGASIMAASSDDGGKTLNNIRVIFRTSTSDNRNFSCGQMGNGRFGIVVARPQESGSYLSPAFVWSDDNGATWNSLTMPSTGNRDFHGKIEPWPTSAGGNDTLGYIVYGYRPASEGGGVIAYSTIDNGATWTERLGVVAPTGQFPNLSELAVTRVANKNQWIMVIRTSAGLNMAVSMSSNMTTWSTPVDSGLYMGGNPPAVFYEDGKIWALSFSRRGAAIIPEYANAIVISQGDPVQLVNSGGSQGWGGWEVLAPSTFWPTGYIYMSPVRGRWYGLFTMAEEQAGNSRGRTAYLGMLCSDPVDSADARQLQNVISGPNSIFNGGLQVWQAGTTFSSFGARTMVADGFTFARAAFAGGATVSRVNGNKARYAMRIRRDDGDVSTAAMNLTCVLTMDQSIPYRNKVVALQFRAIAGSGFSANNGFLSVQVRQTNNPTEQNVTNSSGLFSIGDAPVDSSGTGVTLDGLWRDFVLVVQNVALDATQLLIRFTWTPIGSAFNDYFDLEMIKMEPGRLSTPFQWPLYSDVLDVAQRFYQVKTVQTENGSRYIPLRTMHRIPSITASAGIPSNINVDGFELANTSATSSAVVANAIL